MNFKIVSLGCPKNLVESEYLVKCLEEGGHRLTEEGVQTVVVNTCAFISDAVRESVETILQEAAAGDKKIVVTGCLVERYGEKLKELLPEATLFLGRETYPKAAGLISGEGFYPSAGSFAETFPRRLLTAPPTAYLKIQEGCDNRCTYCTIPLIRGGLVSRPIPDIVREFRFLVDSGFKEINIIGQDITAYGRDAAATLEELVRSLLNAGGDSFVRLMYMHPAGLRKGLVDLMRKEERIIPYLDIPIQHCEDRVLQAMGRRHTKADLEKLLGSIRDTSPDMTLRTSLIVGFPGETEEEFEGLCAFIEKWQFDMLGVFMYSREEGTPAYKMKPQIRKSAKQKRFNRIMEMQKEISKKRLSRLLGRETKVIIEGKEESSMTGRILTQAPDIDGIAFVRGDCAIGEIRDGKIVKTLDYDVIVELQ